jgi:hypothetical protein
MSSEKSARSVLDRFREKPPFNPTNTSTPGWNRLTTEMKIELLSEMEVFFEEPTPLSAPQGTVEQYALFMAHQFAARQKFLQFVAVVQRDA